MAERDLGPVPSEVVHRDVAAALAEDLGDGDLTAALVPEAAQARARVVSRSGGVVCGQPWFDAVFAQLDPGIAIRWSCEDGDRVGPGDTLCEITGPARPVLSGERTALNFLQTLSGTATVTARYVEAVAATDCRVLDTRKTLPGLRQAQKYAVRCGGGTNHRTGLFDGILIKENHIVAAGGIGDAVRLARNGSDMPVEVEVEDLEEAEEAMAAGADILLLDNFGPARLREAVSLRDRAFPQVRLEASGNLELDDLREVAETGVDYISVGALTKHLEAMDLSMRFRLQAEG